MSTHGESKPNHATAEGKARFVEVALPLPLHASYTYRVPTALEHRARLGDRVVVPVRRREVVGVVVDREADPPVGITIRDLLAAPDSTPAIPEPLLETARWMASYYGAPLGLALRVMLPRDLWGSSRVMVTLRNGDRPEVGGLAGELIGTLARRGGEAPLPSLTHALRRPLWDVLARLTMIGLVSLRCEPAKRQPAKALQRVVEITGEMLTLVERAERFRNAPKQRLAYETLEQMGGTVPVRHLLEEVSAREGVVRSLVKAGLVRIGRVPLHRDPFATDPGVAPPDRLSPRQAEAVEQLQGYGPGERALLYGVTGSGKTVVYLKVIEAALAQGEGAILLVPEISLTPQTVGRVRGMFGDAVAVVHSGLSDGERLDAWRAIRSGERRVVVGARSAIFAPVQRLGVIVIDEEHEASYKNGETPRYHARDVAVVRARTEGARVIYGSATPSLELWSAPATRLHRVTLPDRVGHRPLPPVEVVDLRTAPQVRGTGAVPWSEVMEAAVAHTLDRKEQALLLLNRRGFSAYLQCSSCGDVPTCPSCSIALTVHRAPEQLRCHYCDHRVPVPTQCAACGHPVQQARGIGTQQLERAVAERFPAARIARMDLDTTGPKWSHHRILSAVERREIDILLGTQMIAKGIDFPGVTVVGVVDADTALHLPDFRAAERTFQLLAQVSGRAGRGPAGGRVVVQTRRPDHPAIRAAATHDTDGFLTEELTARQSPPYPPHTEIVNLLVSGDEELRVGREAAELAEWVEALIQHHGLALQVLGPAPCPVARIKSRWRWHALVKGTRRDLGRLVRYLAPRLAASGSIRIHLDRDPVSLL